MDAGDAEAAGNTTVDAPFMWDVQVVGGLAHTFGYGNGPRGIGAGQNGDEFLSAVAGNRVFNPEQRFGQRTGDGPETNVAGLVAIEIIELLEKIDVAEHDAQWTIGAQAAFPLDSQSVIKMAAVGNSGQAVQAGNFF